VVFKILKMKNTNNFISNDVASAKKEEAGFLIVLKFFSAKLSHFGTFDIFGLNFNSQN